MAAPQTGSTLAIMPGISFWQNLMTKTDSYIIVVTVIIVAFRVLWVLLGPIQENRLKIAGRAAGETVLVYGALFAAASVGPHIKSVTFTIVVLVLILGYSGYASGFSIVDVLLSLWLRQLLPYKESDARKQHIVQHLLNQPTPNLSGLSGGFITTALAAIALMRHVPGLIYLFGLAASLLVVFVGAQIGAYRNNQMWRAGWIKTETDLAFRESTQNTEGEVPNSPPSEPSPSPRSLRYLALASILFILSSRRRRTD